MVYWNYMKEDSLKKLFGNEIKNKELEKLLRECNIEHESVNIDSMDGEGLSLKYNIKSLPTLLVTDNEGNLLRKLSGMVSKEKLLKFIYQ